jgi:hypothetical protein
MATKPLSNPSPATLPLGVQLGLRIVASLVGGYAFVWGFIALGTVTGVFFGMSYSEAQTLLYFFAFLLFTAAFCWAYVARTVLQVWVVLGVGGCLMTVIAWLGARALS